MSAQMFFIQGYYVHASVRRQFSAPTPEEPFQPLVIKAGATVCGGVCSDHTQTHAYMQLFIVPAGQVEGR